MSTRREFLAQAAATGVVTSDGIHLRKAVDKIPDYQQKGRLARSGIPNTDLVTSRIAYGCADLGSWNTQLSSEDLIAKATELIYCAYENGINFFDHSDIYSFGRSEEVFGEVLKRAPGLRNKIIIQSKSGMVFNTPVSGSSYFFDCSYEHIIESVEASLRRFRTDYLDILLLHWPDALIKPDEIAKAFDELKKSGKVCYFGVSNHNQNQIELLKKVVQQPLVVNQLYLGLAFANFILEGFANTVFIDNWKWGITGTLDYCRRHDIQIQAYAPLRGGFLNPTGDAPPPINEAAKLLEEFARKKSSAPSAIALAWLLHHPASIVPIIGSTNPNHIVENCSAEHVVLTREEWYMLLRVAAKIQQL